MNCFMKDFMKKLSKRSGIGEEKEELLGVNRMIRIVDLERKVAILEAELRKKEKELRKERRMRKEK